MPEVKVDLLSYVTSTIPTPPPDYNFASDIRKILDDGNSVFISVRHGAAGIIPYIVDDLDLPTRAVIECESPDVEITAASPEGWIINCTEAVRRATVRGGTWGGPCAGVLRGRDENFRLITCLFEDNYVRNAAFGFDIGQAAGVRIRDCQFTNLSGTCISLGIDRYANTNTIENCRFFDCDAGGIVLGNADSWNQIVGNSIRGCWFERLGGEAIVAHGATTLAIDCCYFEECSSDGGVDVLISDAGILGGGRAPSYGVVLRDCAFAGPKKGQLARVRNRGRASLSILGGQAELEGAMVVVQADGLIAGGRDYRVKIDTTIRFEGNPPKPANYQSAAYRRGGTQTVDWTINYDSQGFPPG